IGRSNFRLLLDISFKESILQLVYDLPRQTPFFKAFLVTADVPEIYMQEFWATAMVHHHSIRHSGAIRRLIDVNINKLHQPWRSFAAIINKYLSGKSSGYDSLWLNIKIQRRAMRCIILGTRLFTFAKGKQPTTTFKAKSLTALSEVAMTKAEQLMLATKRSLQQTHISQASGSGKDEGTGDDGDDDEEGSDEQDNDDVRDDDDDQEEGNDDDQDSDEEGEEFIHLKISVHDEEETRDEESFDPIPKTPKNTDGEGNGEENLKLNVGREEGQDEEDDEDELYRDVNINLEGRGAQMADVHTTQEFKDSHVTLTLVNPDGIESIFETSSHMDVQVPTSVAPLPVFAPTLTPSTIATITTVQQAPTPPTTAPSTLLQNLPNFGSLFRFDHRLKTLEDNFSVFVQTNHFAGAVSFIPEMTVNEQLEAEVLTRSSNSSSYAVAVDLSEMELKKILIEKMKGNKSFHRCNEQRNLYKALVEAYESDKIILETYRDTVTLKRRRDDDADKDEEPSVGSDRGSKIRREGKEPESASALKEKATRSAGKSTQGSKSRQTSVSDSATVEEPMQTTHEMEEPSHLEFETSANDQPIAEPSQQPEWFSKKKKPPTPDHDWNKTLLATPESIQPWISELAKQTNSHSSFNELMDTPVDFSTFLMNRLKVNTLTMELLAGLTYELMKGSCKRLVELEFFLEEVYKAMTDQLDWVNPEGQQYPHNLLNPLLLIPTSRGHHVILFDHFINNDLEYLHGGSSSRKYTTSVTKTKAADYEHIKWIEDLVPQTMESARDVYSKHRIIAVTELKIVEWHNYKHLDWITMRKDDDKLYKFKE
nr:hypothetical protein [Tanacetum cinerariifolium]